MQPEVKQSSYAILCICFHRVALCSIAHAYAVIFRMTAHVTELNIAAPLQSVARPSSKHVLTFEHYADTTSSWCIWATVIVLPQQFY